MSEGQELPTYEEAQARVSEGRGRALDRFIVEHEPAGAEAERQFREELAAVLREARSAEE